MIIFDFELKYMEDFIKFVFYAIIFVIYVVSQIRKAKNKKAEEAAQRSELDPKLVVVNQKRKQSESQTNKRTNSPERPVYEERATKPLLQAKSKEIPKVQVEYKTLDVSETVEDLRFKKAIEDRKIKEGTLVKSKIVHGNEDPYSLKKPEKSSLTDWLQSKSSIKQAFVASEIFKRKY